jgi:hypothetical protein
LIVQELSQEGMADSTRDEWLTQVKANRVVWIKRFNIRSQRWDILHKMIPQVDHDNKRLYQLGREDVPNIHGPQGNDVVLNGILEACPNFRTIPKPQEYESILLAVFTDDGFEDVVQHHRAAKRGR